MYRFEKDNNILNVTKSTLIFSQFLNFYSQIIHQNELKKITFFSLDLSTNLLQIYLSLHSAHVELSEWFVRWLQNCWPS
ncbi:hypothetical protein V6Z11_A04G000500 [Gossypium hirsutum]